MRWTSLNWPSGFLSSRIWNRALVRHRGRYLMDVGSLRVVRNMESDKELVKPSSNGCSNHGADDRDPEPFVAAVAEYSPPVASNESEKTWSKVSCRVNGIAGVESNTHSEESKKSSNESWLKEWWDSVAAIGHCGYSHTENSSSNDLNYFCFYKRTRFTWSMTPPKVLKCGWG